MRFDLKTEVVDPNTNKKYKVSTVEMPAQLQPMISYRYETMIICEGDFLEYQHRCDKETTATINHEVVCEMIRNGKIDELE